MALSAPTKGNLTKAKRSRALAENGYELMDKKRNILIRELMERIDAADALQKKVNTTFASAYASMRMAEAGTGGRAYVAAAGIPIDNGLDIRFRSVMGVEIPIVTDKDEDVVDSPPYGLAFTNSDLDNAYLRFVEVKKLLLELSETENAIYRLAYAIKKSQKRANALKNIVIPGLDSEISRISEALEEKEREEFVRLKVVKEQKGI